MKFDFFEFWRRRRPQTFPSKISEFFRRFCDNSLQLFLSILQVVVASLRCRNTRESITNNEKQNNKERKKERKKEKEKKRKKQRKKGEALSTVKRDK